MFNYFVMIRKIDNHFDREIYSTKAFTKRGAISKIVKQLKKDEQNIEELELAVFSTEEYRDLRYDEITNSNRFNLLSNAKKEAAL